MKEDLEKRIAQKKDSDTAILYYDKFWCAGIVVKNITTQKYEVLAPPHQYIDLVDPPKPKTISSRLDKLGLLEYKEHSENGNGYHISLTTFREIIEPIYPSIFSSYSSDSSGKDDKKTEPPEEPPKKLKNNPEESEANEEEAMVDYCNVTTLRR